MSDSVSSRADVLVQGMSLADQLEGCVLELDNQTALPADNSPQEQCYDNLRISRNAWDTNLVKVSHSIRKITTTRAHKSRPIRCFYRSIGRPAVAARLPSSPCTKRASSQNIFRCFGDTRRWCWILTGMLDLLNLFVM